jgi:uncharacterized membrane protein YcaP (DUF421 family)
VQVNFKDKMAKLFFELFGEGRDLNILQMSCRGVVVFFIALLLIRVSGRRSFSLHTPLDNIITIVLGAVLSRAIVGASGFLPVLAACAVIVVLHRAIAWGAAHHRGLSRIVQGNKMILFEDGKFIAANMSKALVCEEDVMEGVRKSALTEDLIKIDKIYIERNGEISAIKKES